MYVYNTTLNGYIGSTCKYIYNVNGYIGPPSGVGSVMLNTKINLVQEGKQYHRRVLYEHVAATKLELEEIMKYLTAWITQMKNEVRKSK